jgi:hypothetical protein
MQAKVRIRTIYEDDRTEEAWFTVGGYFDVMNGPDKDHLQRLERNEIMEIVCEDASNEKEI